MKKIALIITLAASTMAWSQSFKRSTGNEVNVNIGFTSSAAAVGGTFEQDSGQIGWGGYAFLQTEKDSASINQTLALGGMAKIHVVKNAQIDTYIAPGFGLAMVNDVSTGGGNTDDKTIFGPSMKIGAQYYFSPTVKVGIERFLIANWFDDEVTSSFEYTTAVIGFDF